MHALRQHIWLLTVIMVTLAVSGCAAPTQRLSDADRARYKTIKISGTVAKVPEAFLMTPGISAGLMGGAIGALATAGPAENARKTFDDFLTQNAVSIESIARDEIERALRESGKMGVSGPDDALAPTLNIAVEQYGFGVTHLLSSNVVPVLMLRCEMKDNQGATLWSAGDRMLPSIASPMDPVAWQELRGNPKRIEEEWRKATRFLAKKIVEEL